MNSNTQKYWSFRDELSIEEGILLKGECIVVPATLRTHYLSRVHEGHPGINRCQQRARSSIFWPGINQHISDMVERCAPCQEHRKSQQREPMEPMDVPNIPWHTLGTDMFHHDGNDYLIICDYFSKYPIVQQMRSTSSHAVAQVTSRTLSMFGLANTIVSDNGPQFIGQAYQELLQKHNIEHVTSSPHHPRGHGFIERQIQTVKSVIKKDSKDIDSALLSLRTTPSGPDSLSPAERLFRRKIQGNLPIYTRGPSDDTSREKGERKRAENQHRYDQHAKPLPELALNSAIYYQDPAKRTWSPGMIVGYGPEPRSYTIQSSRSGKFLRRNRQLIRPRKVDENEGYIAVSPARCTPTTAELPRASTPSTPSANVETTLPRAPPEHQAQVRRSTRPSVPPKRLIKEM